MNKQDLTIFQKLTKAFGFQGQMRKPHHSFELSKSELLKTDSREDFEKAKLQAQQTQYITDKWAKMDTSLYNQSVYYEPNRLSAYYDFESMEFSIAGETKIPTPDGFVTIKELADKGRDYEFITYAYDHNLKKIVPTIARNAHYTRDEMTYKITFDDKNESYIIATYGHRFLKRDGTFCLVEDLKVGDSMMPFYRKSFYNNKKYNWIYTANSNEGYHGWVSEHNIIAEWFYNKKILNDEEVHHIDFNGKNNHPENLKIMNIHEHRSYHANIHNKKMWENKEYRKLMSEVAKRKSKYSWDGKRSGKNNPAYFHIPFDLIIETARKNKTLLKTSKELNIAHTKLQREIMWAGYKDWSTFCDAYNIKKSKYSTCRVKGEQYKLNHKIKSIEPYGVIPVYDLTVPGYKNFATDTIFSHNTPEISAALDIYSEESCLAGDTLISLNNDQYITIEELYESNKTNFSVWGHDREYISPELSNVEKVIFKGIKDVYQITLDDDTKIKCTNDHKWLNVDNNWVETEKLKINDKLYTHFQEYDYIIKDIKYVGKEKVYDLLNSSVDSSFIVQCKNGGIVSHNCTKSEKGEILSIHSDSKRIKSILDDLFYNTLDINTNIQMWTRGMCKYGDNFVYLKIDPQKGIVGCQQLPNIEIERIEGARAATPNQSERVSTRIPTRELRFTWKNKDMEFQSWEIAHFRLLGDDRKMPYGTCLKSDSYISTEHGIKEIKDIVIGDKVWSFDTETEKMVLSSVLDTVKSGEKICYQICTKHNFIEASEEHKIMVFENKKFKYKNVLDIKVGDILVIDNSLKLSNEIKIDKITPNENKNGWFNASNLIPNYIDDEFAKFLGFMFGDGWVSNNGVYFALSQYEELNDYYISILNKYTSNPVKILSDKNGKESIAMAYSKCLKTILERMGFVGKSTTKRIPKWVYELDEKKQKSFLDGLIDADGWITQDKWTKSINIELSNKNLVRDVKLLCQKIGYKSGSVRSREPRENIIIEGRKIKTTQKTYSLTFYESKLKQTKIHDNIQRLSNDYILEPIIKILDIGKHETYDIYVENDNHNFIANGIVVHNSMLDKIRRIWKQLLLAEDAMLIYRISRAPERRVFKVFVGNMDDKDVEPYIQRIANKFKRDPIVDQRNGQVDMRYNQMAIEQDFFLPVRDPNSPSPIETLPGACISLETKIPLLDGRILTLNEIINEWNDGNKDLWVYSCNPENGELAPGIVSWAGITRKNTEVLKITLDNGKEIISTPDHKFVHRTKGFVEAQNLNIGDSLMPFYQNHEYIVKKKYSKKYEQIWDSKKEKWVFTHRMVNDFMKKLSLSTYFMFEGSFDKNKMKTIHHKDNNRFNNNPNNLTLMDSKDHYIYHRYDLWSTNEKKKKNCEKISKGIKRYIDSLTPEEKKQRHERLKQYHTDEQINILLEWRKNSENNKIVGKLISEAYTEERRKKQSEQNIELWKNEEFRKKVFKKEQKISFKPELYDMFVEEFEKNGRSDLTLIELNKNEKFLSLFRESNKDIRSTLTNLQEFTHNHVDKMMKHFGYKNYRDWLKKECKKRGYKNLISWRYYIRKKDLYNHKIINIEWLTEKIDTGTLSIDNDELHHNYHTFATESGVFIKNSNLSEIEDIEYIQKKMLAALRIPKAFLGFEDVIGNGKGLSLLDIRFARTINRIQQSVIQELNKIALIHLYLLGFEDELNNFMLSMTNPSGQSELLKIEQWKEKITMYKDATSDNSQMGILPVSHTWAKKNILGMSDNEIILDLQQQRLERAMGAELMGTQNIIKRSGIFDEVDSKYGIPEEERVKIEGAQQMQTGEGGMPPVGGEMTPIGGETIPPPPVDGEPLNEGRKRKILSMLDEDMNINNLFDVEKSQRNIYEIEKKIKEMLND